MVPVVAVKTTLFTALPVAPTAPWNVVPPELVTVKVPKLSLRVPTAPCTSTVPVTLKVAFEAFAVPPAALFNEAIVTLLEVPVPTVRVESAMVVAPTTIAPLLEDNVALAFTFVTPSVIAPLPEDNVAMAFMFVTPRVIAVFVVEILPKILLVLLVLFNPPAKICPPPKVTPPVFIKEVGVVMVPGPLMVNA